MCCAGSAQQRATAGYNLDDLSVDGFSVEGLSVYMIHLLMTYLDDLSVDAHLWMVYM